jgi:hypothetical protein
MATAEVFAFEAAPRRAISQRQFAKEHGLPRSTLQHWLSRKATIDADPALVAFFESPVGLAFLQSTSDEAKGILAHVREGLGAHHSPDLFHAQHELHKASSLPLQAQVSRASQQVEQAVKQKQLAQQEYQVYRKGPPRPGFPPDFS